MKTVRTLAFLGFCLTTAPAVAEQLEDRFIERPRQLTYEGARAGEGYFSPDGSKLVFQSERETGNPFYQIYELNLATGDTRRISPGHGKTTCPFFRPGDGDILYASTHHDPQSVAHQQAELDFRASGQQRRYAWDYDPEMDLYAQKPDGSTQRLTRAIGYDAEGSYSPDGKWIAFASNRQIFAREPTAKERETLGQNPAFFAEIYLMPAGGGAARRLTDADGYDGGPFFMPDGKRIIWRRFDGEGLIADLWTMELDGSDARRITDFESMSWAPYPHPSGEYFIFTTNKHGFENFELFIVDSGGLKQPVRVTFTERFDGLPVFSPDGRRLAWTSLRGSGDGAQLWIARWDHAAASEALDRAPLREGGKP